MQNEKPKTTEVMYVLFINPISSYLLATFLIVGAILLYKGFYHLARRIQD